MLERLPPLTLVQQQRPFSDPDWLFEVKFDGFRAVAYVEGGRCELVSRKGNTYRRFKDLAEGIGGDLNASAAVLDGEIVCLDDQGRTRFYDLMFQRGTPYFYAFDLLSVDGEDLRDRPLLERKVELRKVVPAQGSRLLYLDYIEEQGADLFEQCCDLDPEGIVAKPKESPYRLLGGKSPWIKFKNPDYSQAEGRREEVQQAARVAGRCAVAQAAAPSSHRLRALLLDPLDEVWREGRSPIFLPPACNTAKVVEVADDPACHPSLSEGESVQSSPDLVEVPRDREEPRRPVVVEPSLFNRGGFDSVAVQRLKKLGRCCCGQVDFLHRADPRGIELCCDSHRVLARLEGQVDERDEHRHRAEQLTECSEVLDGHRVLLDSLFEVAVDSIRGMRPTSRA